MHRLYDLAIRKKFAIVLIPLIIVIIIFDFLEIKSKYLDYTDAKRLSKAITLGIEINRAVHELQKERSISAGYLASGGRKFNDELSDQRIITDSIINIFIKEASLIKDAGYLNLHEGDIALIENNFNNLEGLRKQVDNSELDSKLSIDYFSQINNTALASFHNLINESRNAEIIQKVHAIIYFLKAKEFSSIERALGVQAFVDGKIDKKGFNKISSYAAKQESYLDAFKIVSDQVSLSYYDRMTRGPEVLEINRMREVLFSTESFDESPSHWYNMNTSRINSLKKVEDFMALNITNLTIKIANKESKNFWLFLIFDLVIAYVTYILVSKITSNLLENVKKLETYTREISRGRLSDKVEINTNDEIGQYANTFKLMVRTVRKSQIALKKQRDRAKFLYDNIYKQSEVIFDNVDQGIFLLDKKLTISKLYSKSMELIFERENIGGMSFADFIRPLIISRDLEALEMYMRHLFNPDMDEEVVNQLNPVDQVKIFTEKNRFVETKYVKIIFSRVIRQGKIKSILVTVTDETKSVLLQQHLEEVEKQKKQETEQVLSVLKIDPSVMRGYIHNAKKTLMTISDKYELHQGQDYRELLDFTFQTIHNLKGNSSAIGLDVTSDKFHQIEEVIQKLSVSGEITGKDFLSILFEIDEVNKMLEAIGDMQRRISSIYREFPIDGAVSNVLVINTVRRILETLSHELDKPVGFSIINDKDVIIPDEYEDTIRDVMIQLIRNSMTHGIESGNIRIGRQKPIKARIKLTLDMNGNGDYSFIYEDDGQGLDIEQIKKWAINKGLISFTESKNMDETDFPSLILKPGFTTISNPNSYSGRGQGMALVKSLVDEKDGTVSLDSEFGVFFRLTIGLPAVKNYNKNSQ